MEKRHQPIHLYLENQLYFITSHTYMNQYLLRRRSHKQHLLEKTNAFFREFDYILYAWVILDNHYHILFKSSNKVNIGKVIGKIHSGYSFERNKQENNRGRKIWQNYWDWCIRSKRDFWTHFNYIHHNPVKHGYVKNMEDYSFSSYGYWLDAKGKEWLYSVFETYPIIDFSTDHDC